MSVATKARRTAIDGIPENCKIEKRPSSSCIICSVEEFHAIRCFLENRKISAGIQCVHTRESVKCLKKDPPDAIVISLRKPQEKILADQYEVWEQTVWSIWESKGQQESLTDLEANLKFLRQASLWISRIDPVNISDTDISSLLMIPTDKAHSTLGETRKVLAQLQASREQGKLNIRIFLQTWLEFLKRKGQSRETINFLESLNLEGLESSLEKSEMINP